MRRHLRDRLDLRFDQLDTDGDGYIGEAEFAGTPDRVAAALGIDRPAELARSREAFGEVWRTLVERADLDADGRIDRAEFAEWVARRLTEFAGAVHASALALFDLVDADGSGELGEAVYTRLVGAFGVGAEDAARGFHRIDLDGDGRLSRTEFASGVTDFYTSEDPAAPGNWLFGRAEPPGEVLFVKPGPSLRGAQDLAFVPGITGDTAGSRALCMHLVVIPPRHYGKPHVHIGHESAIYVVSGVVEVWHGPDLRIRTLAKPGSFIYVPPDTPHFPVNHSGTERVVAVVARTDPNEQESVHVLEPPGHLDWIRDQLSSL